MDPQQELFTALLTRLKELGYDVYDGGLPPEGTPYPFVYLADMQQIDRNLKDVIHGTVYPSIHVWHNNPKQRGTLSQIMLNAKGVCRGIKHTKNFAWSVRGMDQRVLTDTTTKTPLVHGIIMPEFYFS